MILPWAMVYAYTIAPVVRLIGACAVVAGTGYRTGAMLASYAHHALAWIIAALVITALSMIVLAARSTVTEATA